MGQAPLAGGEFWGVFRVIGVENTTFWFITTPNLVRNGAFRHITKTLKSASLFRICRDESPSIGNRQSKRPPTFCQTYLAIVTIYTTVHLGSLVES